MLFCCCLLLFVFSTLQNSAASQPRPSSSASGSDVLTMLGSGSYSGSNLTDDLGSGRTSSSDEVTPFNNRATSSSIVMVSSTVYISTSTDSTIVSSGIPPSYQPQTSSTPVALPVPTPSPTSSMSTTQTSFTSPPPTPAVIPVFEVPVTTYGNNTCEPYYAGGHCQSILENFPTVITNLSRSTQSVARVSSDAIYRALLNFSASEQCLRHAVPLLCRYSFPTCDPAFVVPTYQPICKRDCEIVRDFTCKRPWEQMIQLLRLLNFGVIDQPNCEPLSNADGGNAPMCIGTVTGGTIPLPLLTGPSCYSGKGRGYNGTINTTASGIPCQSWSFTYPHQHLLYYEDYPELRGGHNFCRNPGERGERPWCFTANRTIRWEYCDVPMCDDGAVCESYTGSVCRTNGTIGMEFIYFNVSHSQESYEVAMVKLIEVMKDYSEGCRTLMIDYVCNLNLPSCDLSNTSPRPKLPCRNYCEHVHSMCGDETKGFRSFGPLLIHDPLQIIFDCSVLPEPNGGEAPECYQPIILPNATAQNTICYNLTDKGLSYHGSINTTSSGRVCQKWVAASPHAHPLTPLNRPNLEGNNYCRNPDGRGDSPWCYTTDPEVRWEYCDVPACSTGFQLSNPVIYGITGGVGFLLLIILCMVCAICSMYCYSRGVSTQHKQAQSDNAQRYIEPVKVLGIYNKAGEVSNTNPLFTVNPMLDVKPTMGFEGLKLPEFPRDRIMYICDLGQGHFGVVVQAEAIGIKPDEEKSIVAIKVLKEGASSQVKKEFFREANLMQTFDHPNIIRLFGVCIEQEPLCIIFELMELGDLNNLLRQNSPKRYNSSPSLSRSLLQQQQFSTQQLVCFSVDIAAGLEYLSQNHYVHRDMATRNCLVNSAMRVKISDFGLSQDVYTTDYFTLGDSELLPIRWMPPEAIVYAKFTTQSDIWSFGVVLWEIFSFGMQPYYSMTNEEVVKHVRDGNVLSCPDSCPAEIYDLMVDCWVMEPGERPIASEIHAGLMRWTPNLSATLQAQAQKPTEYQNMAVVREYAQQPSTISDGAQFNASLLEGDGERAMEFEERNGKLASDFHPPCQNGTHTTDVDNPRYVTSTPINSVVEDTV